MNLEETKQKRVEYIMEMIFKYTTEEPILTPEEVLFATCFHLAHEEGVENILKKLKKELKSKW